MSRKSKSRRTLERGEQEGFSEASGECTKTHQLISWVLLRFCIIPTKQRLDEECGQAKWINFLSCAPTDLFPVGHRAVTFRGESARVQTEKKCQARAVCPGAFAFNTSNSRICFYLEQCDANESHCHMYADSHFCYIKVLQLWPRDRKQSVPSLKSNVFRVLDRKLPGAYR